MRSRLQTGILLSTTFLAACGSVETEPPSTNTTTTTTTTQEQVCTPGESVSCTCQSGPTGNQVCKADGSGYGACDPCDDAWSTTLTANPMDTRTRSLVVLPDEGVLLITLIGSYTETYSTTHLVRLDSHGQKLWEHEAPILLAAAADAQGKVVVGGKIGAGQSDLLGRKLDCPATGQGTCGVVGGVGEDGMFEWAKVLPPGNGGYVIVTALGLAADGRIGVVGNFGGSVSLGGTPLYGGSATSAFVAQLSATGELAFQDAVQMAGEFSSVRGLAVEASGAMAVSFSLTTYEEPAPPLEIDFGQGPVPIPGGTGSGLALARWDAQGALQWAKVLTGSAGRESHLVLGKGGDLLFSVGHEEPVDLDGCALGAVGQMTYSVARIDGAGACQQAIRVGGFPNQGGPPDFAFAVGEDAKGRIWAGGGLVVGTMFQGQELMSKSLADAALFVHDASGSLVEVRQFGVTGVHGIDHVAFTADGDPVITGISTGSIDLGQGTLSCWKHGDTFVAKLAP